MDEVERIRQVYASYEADGREKQWGADAGMLAERERLLGDVLADLGAGHSTRVLDLGCGAGQLLGELQAAGIDPSGITGVDLLPDRLGLARDRGFGVAVASGAALPFGDDSFDLVTCFTVLSSVRDCDVLAGLPHEIARVLRPGGSLVLYDMRLPSPHNRAVIPLPLGRIRGLFPGWSVTSQACTLLPPLARSLAPRPGPRYDRLARVAVLRSHRLSVLRPGGPGAGDPAGMGLAPLAANPTVSVILPIRNESVFIDQSLGAVFSQVGAPTPEVIVVDGHSDDGTPERVQEVATLHGAPVTLVDNPSRIVPISMNLGLAKASGQVIIRVDGHCVIDDHFIEQCLVALAETGAECVGGPMETIGETPVAAAIAAAQSSRFGVGGVAFRTSTEAALVDTLAFGAYRREVFDQIGTFDESFVRNQDDELNLRLTRAGGRIWMDPRIRSTYFSRGTFAGLWRQYHGYGFYKVAVMRKHRVVPSIRHLVPAAFVAGTTGALALSLLKRSPVPLVLVLGPYGVGLAVSSAQAATPRARPAPIALASATMHAAYGLGWLAGAARAVPDIAQSRLRSVATRWRK